MHHPRKTTSTRTGSEYSDALAEVLADQKRREHVRKTAGKPRKRRRLHPATPLALLPLTVWLWVAPPAFLGPRPLPELSPERREAGTRVTMTLLARRINAWSEEHSGRLPADLAEAGEEQGEIRYLRLTPTTYRLRAEVGPSTIDYLSSERLDSFVAEAKRTIEGGAK